MPTYIYVIVAVGSLVMVRALSFAQAKRRGPQKLGPRARWGIALSLSLLVTAGILSWTGARALGRQWRLDAGLNHDHELVQSGPTARSGIPSTLPCCVCYWGGLMITPLLLLVVATILFVAGTEIRVGVEAGLLESHFGDHFRDHRHRVSAYIPLLR